MKIKKKYLVTGGAGFIGSHLIEKLINCDCEIVCIDNLSSGKLDNLPNNSSIILFERNLLDIDDLELGSDLDGIFHLAAQTAVPFSIKNFYESSENNLIGMLKVWDIAKKKQIPVVYASSSAIYGNLEIGSDEIDSFEILSPYALDKLTMEKYALIFRELYNLGSIGLRFFNVYGPRQDPKNPYSGVISLFLESLMNNKSVIVNGGFQTRDFIYIDDVINTLIKSMNYIINKNPIDILNVGTGTSTSVENLLKIISKLLKIKPNVIRKDLPHGDPIKSSGTYNKIKSVLKIDVKKFTRLEDGLKKTIDKIILEKK